MNMVILLKSEILSFHLKARTSGDGVDEELSRYADIPSA